MANYTSFYTSLSDFLVCKCENMFWLFFFPFCLFIMLMVSEGHLCGRVECVYVCACVCWWKRGVGGTGSCGFTLDTVSELD